MQQPNLIVWCQHGRRAQSLGLDVRLRGGARSARGKQRAGGPTPLAMLMLPNIFPEDVDELSGWGRLGRGPKCEVSASAVIAALSTGSS